MTRLEGWYNLVTMCYLDLSGALGEAQMIEVKDLVYYYYMGEQEEALKALDGVSLEIQEGEFLAIIGANGSGKSTLAKHLNGLLLPAAGDISVDGISTREEKKIWELRQKVGMVFQNPDNQIVAAMVEEDVAFGPENLGVPSQEIKQRVNSALQTVGMEKWRKHPPHLLSGGQKQRVAIAGALALGSKYLILDEPTAMLDPVGRREVLHTIKKLNEEQGITVILITHFMQEAVEAKRVLVMERGKMFLEGKPQEIFSEIDKLKELGLDVPPITELAFLLRQEGIHVPLNIFRIDEMVRALCPYL